MRLFAAVRLPEAEEPLLKFIGGLRAAARGTFPDRGLLHVTLAFIGETDRPEAAAEALRQGVERCGAGRLSVTAEGVGRFGETLYVGVRDADGALSRLAESVQTALREAGFAIEERPFVPHVTVARHYRGPAPETAGPWPAEVREVLLLESGGSPLTSRYQTWSVTQLA